MTKNYINTSTTASLLCPVSGLYVRLVIDLEVFGIFGDWLRGGFGFFWLFNFLLASTMFFLDQSLAYTSEKRCDVSAILRRHLMVCCLVSFCILLQFLRLNLSLWNVRLISHNKNQRIIDAPCIPHKVHPLVQVLETGPRRKINYDQTNICISNIRRD